MRMPSSSDCPYLDAIVQRTDSEGNPIEAALKPVFSDPLLAGVWMLADKGGKKYYLLEDPAAKLNSLAIGHEVRFRICCRFRSFQEAEVAPRHRHRCRPGRGSATRDGEGVGVRFWRRQTMNSWEPSFCRMVQTVLNDKDTDPLLKHFLLRKIVAVGCQGSLCFQNGFAGFAAVLKDSKVPRLGQLG